MASGPGERVGAERPRSDGGGDERGPRLLALARQAVEEAVTRGCEPGDLAPPGSLAAGAPWLAEPGATFVTLRSADGALRGCLGSLHATAPLLDDLRYNAAAAALRDPRFPPVSPDELDELTLEVTLLDPPQPLPVADEAEAVALLRPGVDGVVLTFRLHRATFLPQVWESLSDPRDFLAQLKRKAGLSATFWHPELELERYTVEKWAEDRPPRGR